MIYITGDTHGNFDHVEYFCKCHQTNTDDVLIILGDAGINYSSPKFDKKIKEQLSQLPITIFAIHGNHEQRPFTIPSYQEKLWKEGTVYYEPEFPTILFAKDGEIFDFDGNKTIVIGGAYSVDKEYRLIRGLKWWEDEQPSDEIKSYVESQLDRVNWNIDVVLSHTTPLKYEPVEVFLPFIDQSTVDKSTEEWLDKIENKLAYRKWYSGHYHTEKKVDKLELMFTNFDIFMNDQKVYEEISYDNNLEEGLF